MTATKKTAPAKKPIARKAAPAKKPVAKAPAPARKVEHKPAAKKPVAMTKATNQRAARPKLEVEIRDNCDAWAELRGWMVQKMKSLSANGFPDCFYARHGRIVFGEWKKPGTGVIAPLQAKRHQELRDHGVEVHVFSDSEHFQEIMK